MKKGELRWVNIYGATGQEGFFATNKTLAKKMNENPSIANKWNGRILISIDSEDTDKPQLKTEDIPYEDLASV